jgi:molybdenum cofactor cytidylyltransferase
MGEPKQLLPWGTSTVLGTVVDNLAAAGAAPVVCVLGHRAAEMAAVLDGLPVQLVENPGFLAGEMLSSYQAGLRDLTAAGAAVAGALLALGDQPHIPVSLIRAVIAQAQAAPAAIVIPSYAMRRGHPFFLPLRLWPELLALGGEETLRTLLRRHEAAIQYVEVATDAILRDIDTPADYRSLAQAPV